MMFLLMFADLSQTVLVSLDRDLSDLYPSVLSRLFYLLFLCVCVVSWCMNVYCSWSAMETVRILH